MRADRIVLTLPPDPAFSRLTRLATQHFLRLHGVRLTEARRRGRAVEVRVHAALRAAVRSARAAARGARGRRRPEAATGGTRRTPVLSLTLVTRPRALEVLLRRDRGGARRLLALPRPEGVA